LGLLPLVLAARAGGEGESQGHSDEHPVQWGYEADDGPGRWGTMDPAWALCDEGLEQSPIDLVDAVDTEVPPWRVRVPSPFDVEVLNQRGVLEALDNGHTIQVNARTGETLSVGDETYHLVQFHFHAPSEHTLNGEHFPMEMHFVHQSQDGDLAVVGLFIAEGAHNPGIEPLWEQLSLEPGRATTIRLPPDLGDHMLPQDELAVFHYRGSLTTPPCTEGVKWYVRKAPTHLSAEQIATFSDVYDYNNRPVRPLNDRTLYLDSDPTVIRE
jgi:carbonic anhydrase